MALIQNIGRSGKIVYGSGLAYTFRVKFTTQYIKTPTGIIRLLDQPVLVTTQDNEPIVAGGYDKTGALASSTSGGVPQSGIDQGSLTATPGTRFLAQTVADTNAVAAGTLTIAGTTVTLGVTDILTPQAVATKIAGTAIAGYTVYAIRDQVTLVNNTLGHSTIPVLALGTATQIQFFDQQWVDGVVVPTNGDDIFIGGRTPVTITLTSTGGTPTVGASTGTPQDQIAGTLTYVTQTLSGGAVTLTTPWNYVKITNFNAATTATLYITR